MEKIIARKISSKDIDKLSLVYKEVFSGFPWYEERICSGSLDKENRCMVQYSSNVIPVDYQWPLDVKERKGVVGNAKELENCVLCNKPLIEFYPNFINQDELIREALSKQGFIGYLIENSQKPIGFSWGYRIPIEVRTKSVNFPIIIPLLESKGINLKRTFYGAELGVIENKQGSGLGLLASAVRLNRARLSDYESLVVRTKNNKVLSILSKIFSRTKGRMLFEDPEKGSPWYEWRFSCFDEDKILNILSDVREEQ